MIQFHILTNDGYELPFRRDSSDLPDMRNAQLDLEGT